MHQRADRAPQPEASLFGGRRGAGRGITQPRAHVGHQLTQQRRAVAQRARQRGVVQRAHQLGQQIQPRPVRGRAARLPAAPPQHREPAARGALGGAIGQAGLSDAGLADQHDELPASGAGAVERGWRSGRARARAPRRDRRRARRTVRGRRLRRGSIGHLVSAYRTGGCQFRGGGVTSAARRLAMLRSGIRPHRYLSSPDARLRSAGRVRRRHARGHGAGGRRAGGSGASGSGGAAGGGGATATAGSGGSVGSGGTAGSASGSAGSGRRRGRRRGRRAGAAGRGGGGGCVGGRRRRARRSRAGAATRAARPAAAVAASRRGRRRRRRDAQRRLRHGEPTRQRPLHDRRVRHGARIHHQDAGGLRQRAARIA